MALSVQIEKWLGDFHLNAAFETEGETLALLGASGCGKSMTLKCIAGIVRPDRGRIVLNDRVLFDSEQGINLPPQKRRVGYLFQQYALFPHMTVEENIAVGLRTKDRAARKAAVAEKVKTFRLEGLEKLRPSQLSGGQQQRTAFARILASEPEVLLLDEPFSALDDHLRWQLELELMDVLRDFSGDTVFVSHRKDEVRRLCQTVTVLTAGRTDPVTTVRTLLERPRTVGEARLAGCRNLSQAERLEEHRIFCKNWGVELETAEAVPGDTAFAAIRDGDIYPASGPDNRIDCRVARVVRDLDTVILMLATPGGSEGHSLLRMELPAAEWEALGCPEALAAAVCPADILLLT